MDLFNKQKLSALQDKLTLATANAEATAKELADLRESIQKSYDELTTYFKPKYVNKYFKYTTAHETIYIKCIDLKYNAGYIEMCSQLQNGSILSLVISISALKNLTIVTRKEFTGEEAQTK